MARGALCTESSCCSRFVRLRTLCLSREVNSERGWKLKVFQRYLRSRKQSFLVDRIRGLGNVRTAKYRVSMLTVSKLCNLVHKERSALFQRKDLLSQTGDGQVLGSSHQAAFRQDSVDMAKHHRLTDEARQDCRKHLSAFFVCEQREGWVNLQIGFPLAFSVLEVREV